MHKDLSENARLYAESLGSAVALQVKLVDQSLAIAREAMINAFDHAAEELDNA